jgi:hypothetical protein
MENSTTFSIEGFPYVDVMPLKFNKNFGYQKNMAFKMFVTLRCSLAASWWSPT